MMVDTEPKRGTQDGSSPRRDAKEIMDESREYLHRFLSLIDELDAAINLADQEVRRESRHRRGR